jgi:Fe-S-cluster containining protein
MSGDEDEKSMKLKNKPRYLFAGSPAESTYKKARGGRVPHIYEELLKRLELLTRQIRCSILSAFVIQCEIHSVH